MARGLQKLESQQKALDAKKKGGNSTLKTKDKGMKYQCATCKIQIDNLSNMKAHWSGKHPKEAEPADEFASMSKAPALVAEVSSSKGKK